MIKLYELKGKIQHYDWGGYTFISDLLNQNTKNKRCAEYWLGAHSNAPSIVKTLKGEQNLDVFLEADPVACLGESIQSKFGRLPFLFKVLDVHDMLSIQVHPTKIEAEKGFKRENDLGIPLTASNRNYKDDNHKPEIMVALSEFWLLHGFLSKHKLIEVLESIPEFYFLISIFKTDGYFGLYKAVMEQDQNTVNKTIKPLIDRILPLFKANKLSKTSPDFWASKAVCSMGSDVIDKGIYSIYFFNILKVEIGEAVFQDAGIPHAYLEGQNMELMANSDNVLRGGLTPKHVDIDELLKHVLFEETIPNIISGVLQPDGIERIYKSPVEDFQLSQIKMDAGNVYNSNSKSVEILILIEGRIEILEGDTLLLLNKGETCILLANSYYKIISIQNSTLYKAIAP